MLCVFAKIFIAPIVLILMRAKVTGWKRLFRKGPMIIVSNHLAVMDPCLIGMVAPRCIHFMAKKELFENPVTNFILQKLLLCFPVDRDKADVGSLKKALSVLEAGKVFGIFPEGRRTVTYELDTLEKGAAFLALRTGAPIVPIWSDPDCYKHFKIHMRVGEAIDPKAIAAKYKGKPVDVVTEEIRMNMIRLQRDMIGERA